MPRPKRKRTVAKYIRIQERFNELYNTKRLRYDDTLQKLSEEFFMSTDSVQKILRKDMN